MATLITQVRSLAAVPTPKGYPTDTAVLFSPRDKVQAAIELMLNSATVSLKVAMFALTDPAVNTILHTKAALPAPFEFQMTLYSDEATTDLPMKAIVAGWATDPRVVTGTSAKGDYSHLKVAVVDHEYIIDGSTNFTLSGEEGEDNTIIVRKHAVLALWYETQLDAIYAHMKAKT